MREIKFRAWDKENKYMLYSGHDIHSIGLGTNGVLSVETSGIDGIHSYIITNFDLMQYTGLKDKNGVEIYEGDIFRYEGFKGRFVVQWETFGWRLKGYIPEEDRMIGAFPPIQMPSNNFEYIEIIGNIYENPELIKEE